MSRSEPRAHEPGTGVHLPPGHSGSSFLYALLREAVESRPEVFRDAGFPGSAKEFKRGLGEALVRFEAARATSAARTEIARDLVRRAHEETRFAEPGAPEGESGALADALKAPAEPLKLDTVPGAGGPGRLVPRVPYAGEIRRGAALGALVEEMLERSALTRAAARSLHDLRERADAAGGALDLSGRKVAVLGAGAELSPVPLLLEAGATVLWIDVRPPPAPLAEAGRHPGTLVHPPGGADLLGHPREVAATLAAFADGDPIDVGLFAYAAGDGQEWRLCQAMDAVVRSLDPGTVRSVGLLVSPTSPGALEAEDAEVAQRRLEAPPLWHRPLRAAGALPDGPLERDGRHFARAVVSLQGASYQAAQYVAKILAAETYALHGLLAGAAERRPVRVSANVAGITTTRSMRHPLFLAAFDGAPAFGVETYAPETTRWLSGLLLLQDWLEPERPDDEGSSAERARALRARQVHGGLYALPYALEPAIRVAAVLGLARRPGHLAGLVRG